MSKFTPITSRAKMNGGIIKGKSSCGCGGGCGCGSSPAKQVSKVKKGLTMAGEGATQFMSNVSRNLAEGASNTAERAVNYARENAGAIAGGLVSGALGATLGARLDQKHKASNKRPQGLAVGLRTSTNSMTKASRPVRKKVESVSAGLKPEGITNPTGVGKMWGAAKVAHGKKSSPAKQTEKSGANVPAAQGQASDKYPLVRGGAPLVQGSGALGALYGGGVKAGANLAMKAAGYLAKSPKTAKIANSIQNFIKGGTKATTPSNIRADGFGGRTTVGSRPNYNNRGSN
jgi:hypothetical protein